MRAVRLADGRLHPPKEDGWGDQVYYCVFHKVTAQAKKRKWDSDSSGNPDKGDRKDSPKMKKIEINLSQKCSDLIVLSLPFKTTDEELKEHFQIFGDLVLAKVNKDGTGQSKGYGFIRFSALESQIRVLGQRHNIEGRWCDVKIPNSKESQQASVLLSPKVYVGRLMEEITSEDLREYFSKFGEVTHAFIPNKPFRGFAFVTFSQVDVAQSLCGEDHVIKNTSVIVSYAAPKSDSRGDSPGQDDDDYEHDESSSGEQNTCGSIGSLEKAYLITDVAQVPSSCGVSYCSGSGSGSGSKNDQWMMDGAFENWNIPLQPNQATVPAILQQVVTVTEHVGEMEGEVEGEAQKQQLSGCQSLSPQNNAKTSSSEFSNRSAKAEAKKRKSDSSGDEGDREDSPKMKKIENKLSQKCSDLIALSLPFKTTDEELKEYFQVFGDVVLAKVNKDGAGKSKGYGFIRFSTLESQIRVLSQRHNIEGRWCEVKIPNSKESQQLSVSPKVHVGRLKEEITENDLREYFSSFGEVTQVFIPNKPFRGFAFVTFSQVDVAQSLCGENHVIKNTSVIISYEASKSDSQWDSPGPGQENYEHEESFSLKQNTCESESSGRLEEADLITDLTQVSSSCGVGSGSGNGSGDKDDMKKSPKNKKFIYNLSQKCSDLIVLSLPFKTTDEELKEYFQVFGDVVLAKVNKDGTGQSKGYGFIRLSTLESQIRVLDQRHFIQGRWCDVKIPNSKESKMSSVSHSPKVYVGRLTEEITVDDLRDYFSKFGEVRHVFRPKPFRGFAFVTFLDADVALSLCGQDHVIKNTSVIISDAALKFNSRGGLSKQGNYEHPNPGFGLGDAGAIDLAQVTSPSVVGSENVQEIVNCSLENLSIPSQSQLNPGVVSEVLNQDSQEPNVSQNVYVGRLTEDITANDIREYFSRFGEVIHVYAPKLFRSFALVTFLHADVAQSICGEDHYIKHTSVTVSSVAPMSMSDLRGDSLKRDHFKRNGEQNTCGLSGSPGDADLIVDVAQFCGTDSESEKGQQDVMDARFGNLNIPSQLHLAMVPAVFNQVVTGLVGDIQGQVQSQVQPQSQQWNVSQNVFVGRLTDEITEDDLRDYFSTFGEVTHVFSPKPFRTFALVTFLHADVAQSLCGKDHVIKNTSVTVSDPAPMSDPRGDSSRKGNFSVS